MVVFRLEQSMWDKHAHVFPDVMSSFCQYVSEYLFKVEIARRSTSLVFKWRPTEVPVQNIEFYFRELHIISAENGFVVIMYAPSWLLRASRNSSFGVSFWNIQTQRRDLNSHWSLKTTKTITLVIKWSPELVHAYMNIVGDCFWMHFYNHKKNLLFKYLSLNESLCFKVYIRLYKTN